MGRPDLLKEMNEKRNCHSVDNCDDDSAARTRPFSFEEIMVRRRNKELPENVKDPAKEACNISPGGSLEKFADHVESPRIYKHDKISSYSTEKHSLDEPVNISSRKKVQSTIVKEDELTEGRDRSRTNNILESKSSAGLNNKGRIPNEKTGKKMCDWRKNERKSDNSEYKAGNKHSRESVNKDSSAEKNRPKSERNPKKTHHIEGDENPNEYYNERKHGKDRHDGLKIKKRLSNDSAEVPEKKHRDSNRDKHAQGREKHEREIRRKYRNGDDEIRDMNTRRKQDPVKHHNPHIYERKNRREKVKSHYEESNTKRRRSRSREREDRRSPSFSPRALKNTYHNGERKDLSMLSLKDSSRKKYSDVDRNRVSTNGSSSHHRRYRHGDSASGLGGYSPRKRKSEMDVKTPSPRKRKSKTDVKTPSPSKHSPEKKRAGWDLPPVGTDSASSAFVSSGFQLSNCSVLSSMHGVASATSLNPAIVKPLQMSFLDAVSTGKNASIDSVQLTQATRPMRRLYLENLPASATEKVVMDCFNNLLLSAGVNQIKQTQPCISCIIHKERGQALVEFLTAEDASAALCFHGSTLFGSLVKVRRPKDYVEVATGETERSVDVADTVSDVADTISDVVVDSPNKIFIGGISNHVSSQMLMEIAGAFGSLKAYHFEARVCNGSCAFLEYVDHFVTIKACAGLNGMTLGGEVLTVVQAMPDESPLENDGKPPSYGIPEHAKPLLRKPTQVLEIKNVFTLESILSLSDVAMDEILEDVRLECARFGTVKSINVVKHNSVKNLATELEEPEAKNEVDSKEASLDPQCVTNNAESSFSEEAIDSMSKGTSGVVGFHHVEEPEEGKDNDASVNVDKNAELFDNTPCQEHIVSDTTVKDVGNQSTPSSIVQGSPDLRDTSNDEPESHDEDMVAIDTDVDIENKIVGGNMDSENKVCPFQEGFSERDATSKLVGPPKDINEEDGIYSHVFEPGSVLVEYARTEACCSAAHCLHGRFFDGRMVAVEYIALTLYKARFTK